MAVFVGGATVPKRVNFVNYIQSSGTQYIDTGFKPNNNTRVVLYAQMVGATSQSAYYCPFGCRGGGLFFELYKASSNNWNLTFLWNNTYTNYFTIDYSARHTFEINKNVATVDSTSLTYTNATFQLGYNLFVGADNEAGSATAIVPMKIYSCKIWDNGTLIRDYLPCLDKDGIACLYDQVNEEYYYNAGSGAFTAG